MCLAIPMEILRVDELQARCALVHVGYALQRVTAQQAHSTWELLDQVLEFHA